jgi:hypothetical protein
MKLGGYPFSNSSPRYLSPDAHLEVAERTGVSDGLPPAFSSARHAPRQATESVHLIWKSAPLVLVRRRSGAPSWRIGGADYCQLPGFSGVIAFERDHRLVHERFKDGRIAACDDLTHMLSVDPADRDFGSGAKEEWPPFSAHRRALRLASKVLICGGREKSSSQCRRSAPGTYKIAMYPSRVASPCIPPKH